jgi:hypothetical protein
MGDFSLTQAAKVNKTAIRQAEARVSEVLDKVWADHDPEVAAKFLAQGDVVEHLNGLMRAEFLYGLSRDWVKQGMSREFYDWCYTKLGKDRVYVERRVRVGAMLADTSLPTVYRQQLKLRSIEELIMLAAAWDTGELRPSSKQWVKLLEQPDPPSLGDEIRRLLGRKERTNTLTIFWKEDGTLEAWQDGERADIGYIKRPPPNEKSLLARAASRLTKGKVKDK